MVADKTSLLSLRESASQGGKMIDCLASQCDYCRSSIVSGQRWVREKIYDPALNGRDPSYHCYHAEPFAGQEGSCWEKHEIEREIARTTARAAYRGHSEQLEFEASLTMRAFCGRKEMRNKPSGQALCP